jgi:hypothetical protein
MVRKSQLDTIEDGEDVVIVLLVPSLILCSTAEGSDQLSSIFTTLVLFTMKLVSCIIYCGIRNTIHSLSSIGHSDAGHDCRWRIPLLASAPSYRQVEIHVRLLFTAHQLRFIVFC